MLAREGALKDLESTVKRACREAISGYIIGGKNLVRGIANGKMEKRSDDRDGKAR